MKFFVVACSLLLFTTTLCTADHTKTSLVVGWSDEFSGLNWKPFPQPNAPDTSLQHKGFLKLSLGSGAGPDPNPYPFYWASVSRIVDVDVERYPILAVRAIHLKGPSWWDVIVQGFDGNDSLTDTIRSTALPSGSARTGDGKEGLVGAEIKSPSLDHDGIVLFDLQEQVKNGLQLGSHRIRVRLNIAGTKKGGSVEYDWLRFVRREDADRLRSNPRIKDIIVEP